MQRKGCSKQKERYKLMRRLKKAFSLTLALTLSLSLTSKAFAVGTVKVVQHQLRYQFAGICGISGFRE